jgi:hypothetical protein
MNNHNRKVFELIRIILKNNVGATIHDKVRVKVSNILWLSNDNMRTISGEDITNQIRKELLCNR